MSSNEQSEDSLVFGLDDLFINKEYSTVSITLPCYQSSAVIDPHNESELGNQGILTLNIASSASASTDHDLTGQILWPVSVLLAHYLASKRGQGLTQGSNIVELGAGCGLPGLTATHYAKEVILTDGNETVMDLLEQNCASFMEQSANHDDRSSLSSTKRVSACTLIWGNVQDIYKIKHQMTSVDVVIAADVVQWPAVVEPFLHSIKALLWDSTCERPICVLGLVDRATSTTQQFFQCAKELGFSCDKVDYALYLRNGEVPNACAEFGGRRVEIYELDLISRAHPPILLNEMAKDVIVGKKFEHTSSLPY